MKVFINCIECQREAGLPSFNFAEVDVNNDFYFNTTCEKGHKTITLLQEERFEVLFEFGCGALLDGYYRETVSSIAAAIERYHEFFMRVVVIQNGFPMDKFDEIWKWMSNQSERQLGAFYLTYLSEFKNVPQNFVEKHAPFRNKVVHKGYIPNKDEANNYAKEAYGYIVHSLQVLKSTYSESINKLIFMNLQNATSANNKLPVSTMGVNSIIGLISGEKDWGSKSFEKALDDFRIRREMLAQLPNIHLLLTEDANDIAKEATYRTHFDPKDGRILGFYPSIIEYETIPEPHIDLTYEEWQGCLKAPDRCSVDTDSKKLVFE
ncbi:hypothetical protein [Propionispora hippei]|uniref:Uncharacterized protein n=1 Tax=Propionispora hippei DSM 15287 TaxID=1123003 RepID=A0A1M6GZ61_9FIRM|nr:hypothetical protein [Propionispora hippei]SHJ15223.1 hypothetical protein SAMN02745170_01829 [Propionispora hippei DSM 15287]